MAKQQRLVFRLDELSGDRVAIGAYGNDGTATNAGHVRVYEYSSGSWSQVQNDIDGEAANDFSGYSVSMNSAGDRVAIGAPYNDGTASDAGHVRIYDLKPEPYYDHHRHGWL